MPEATNIDEIATFVRVVRQGSLAGAARDLGVPKSTISRRVARLEGRLNTELFIRSPRRVIPTSEGRRLYDRVATSVDAIELAVDGSLRDADFPRGHIRMTAPADFGRLVLVDELISFGDAFPEVTIDLELTDRMVDLAAEGFDLAIRAGTNPTTVAAQDLIRRQLVTTSLHLAADRRLAKRIRTVADLSEVPFVLFRASGTTQTLLLETSAGKVHDLSIKGRFVVHDYTTMADLVARGAGVGLLPAMHIARAPTDGQLVRVLPNLSASGGSIAIVYPTRRLSTRIKVLVEHLTRRLS